jgi:hypothetical protein
MTSVWRPRPGWIAALFISLLLAASAERRLAELSIRWLDVVAFENAEEPEGDQIAKRLVIAEDYAPLRPPGLIEVRRTAADTRPPRLHPTPAAGRPEPRAPPLV